jgi:hypothetical protein
VPYVAALAVTVIVEVPIYLWLGRRALGVRDRSGLPVYGGINLLSHPLLWFALAPAGAGALGTTTGLLTAEGLVTMGEGLAVAQVTRTSPTPALAIAALANAASFGLGLAVSAF